MSDQALGPGLLAGGDGGHRPLTIIAAGIAALRMLANNYLLAASS
jgi:hypothetical protein